MEYFFSLQIIPVAGIALNGSNLVGYVRCRRDARAKISAMASRFIGRQIINQVRNLTITVLSLKILFLADAQWRRTDIDKRLLCISFSHAHAAWQMAAARACMRVI